MGCRLRAAGYALRSSPAPQQPILTLIVAGFSSCLSRGTLTVSITVSASVIWIALAYGSNLRKITEGASVCLAGQRSYDSVAAAQMIGRLDLVSFLLTIGGILLAVFAFMGFWMIRREALDEAARVAADEVRRIAQDYFAATPSAKTSGDNLQPSRHTEGTPQTQSSFDPSKVSIAGAVEETGATDAKSKRRSRSSSRAPTNNSGSDS